MISQSPQRRNLFIAFGLLFVISVIFYSAPAVDTVSSPASSSPLCQQTHVSAGMSHDDLISLLTIMLPLH